MMPKICITMALLCFTLLVQLDSIKARPDSNSRYLLVELDGSPNMQPETLPEDEDVTSRPRVSDQGNQSSK